MTFYTLLNSVRSWCNFFYPDNQSCAGSASPLITSGGNTLPGTALIATRVASIAPDCDKHIKSSLCKAEEHPAIDSLANWGRQTLAQRTPPRTEESEPAMHTGEEETADVSTAAET